MRSRIAIYTATYLVLGACIIDEHKSQGKFANAFVRSMRIAARQSDAYIRKVTETTHMAIKNHNMAKLEELFSGQDSSTAIKAYRDFIDEKFHSSSSIGTMADNLIANHKYQNINSTEHRILLGYTQLTDKLSKSLDVHIDLMRTEHTDLKELIADDFKIKRMEEIAHKWRDTDTRILRLLARKIDHIRHQVMVAKQLQAGKTWEIGKSKLPSALTDAQRKAIDKEKIFDSKSLHKSLLKRSQRLKDMHDPIYAPFGRLPNIKALEQEESLLRREIDMLLDINDKFLQQLK